jgi:hypothetical protein
LPAVTVMVKLQLFEWPAASVTVETTVFVPIGKALPEGGMDTIVSGPQPPVATGAKVTVSVHLPRSGCVTMLLGQLMRSGALVTVMRKLQLAELLAASVAVQTTTFVPSGKTLPEGGGGYDAEQAIAGRNRREAHRGRAFARVSSRDDVTGANDAQRDIGEHAEDIHRVRRAAGGVIGVVGRDGGRGIHVGQCVGINEEGAAFTLAVRAGKSPARIAGSAQPAEGGIGNQDAAAEGQRTQAQKDGSAEARAAAAAAIGGIEAAAAAAEGAAAAADRTSAVEGRSTAAAAAVATNATIAAAGTTGSAAAAAAKSTVPTIAAAAKEVATTPAAAFASVAVWRASVAPERVA